MTDDQAKAIQEALEGSKSYCEAMVREAPHPFSMTPIEMVEAGWVAMNEVMATRNGGEVE